MWFFRKYRTKRRARREERESVARGRLPLHCHLLPRGGCPGAASASRRQTQAVLAGTVETLAPLAIPLAPLEDEEARVFVQLTYVDFTEPEPLAGEDPGKGSDL